MKNRLSIPINEVIDNLGETAHVINFDPKLSINTICKTIPGSPNALTFIGNDRSDGFELLSKTQCKIVICNSDYGFKGTDKCLLIVDDPKLCFSVFSNTFFLNKPEPRIHDSSVIDPEAKIHESVYIGPNCTIGKVEIGEDSVLYGNIFLYDNVKIGKNVNINAGCVIGSEGFGYNRDQTGKPIQFPHVGGVVIEDNVDIGSNTSIDRGALSNTIIKQGAKIDNLVHIAHNVIIGEEAYIIANAMIGGSTVIGDHTYIAPSASLKDQLVIGDDVLIGMAAVLHKNVVNGEVWTGNPARNFKELKKLQRILNKLLSE